MGLEGGEGGVELWLPTDLLRLLSSPAVPSPYLLQRQVTFSYSTAPNLVTWSSVPLCWVIICTELSPSCSGSEMGCVWGVFEL